jgi:hypothetical protein
MVVVEGQLLVADVVVPSGVGAMSGHFSNQSTNQSKAGSETNPGPIHLLLISSGYSSFPRGSVIGAVVQQLLARLWISSRLSIRKNYLLACGWSDVPRKSTGQTSLATDNIDEDIAARYTVS